MLFRSRLLREKNIDTPDLREEIKKDGLDWSSLFFKTDHHWTPQTAFWASGKIMDRIQTKYGYDVNMSYYDRENYEYTNYKNWMLGSVGRRTGTLYDGLDDISLFNPKFDTDFSFWDLEEGSDDKVEIRKGSFWDTMYVWENLEKRADFERNTYSTYLGKDCAIARIINKKSHTGLKVLLIRESFSCALSPDRKSTRLNSSHGS